jgi:hypothetical protein
MASISTSSSCSRSRTPSSTRASVLGTTSARIRPCDRSPRSGTSSRAERRSPGRARTWERGRSTGRLGCLISRRLSRRRPSPSTPPATATSARRAPRSSNLFTGSDIFAASVTVPAASSKVEPGAVPQRDVTLSWATFSDAADQAGLSRRYGGIHFEQGDLDARATGRLAARRAWAKAQTYFNGAP